MSFKFLNLKLFNTIIYFDQKCNSIALLMLSYQGLH